MVTTHCLKITTKSLILQNCLVYLNFRAKNIATLRAKRAMRFERLWPNQKGVKCIFISVLGPFLPFLEIYGFWYGFSNIVMISHDVDDDSSVFHSVQHWKGLRNCTHLSVIHLPVYLFWNFTIQFKQLERWSGKVLLYSIHTTTSSLGFRNTFRGKSSRKGEIILMEFHTVLKIPQNVSFEFLCQNE